MHHGKLGIELLLLISLVGVSVYSIVNLAKFGQFFGHEQFKKIDLVELLSYGNIYNKKNICTEGYFVKTESLSILKVNLSENQYTRSAWINTDKQIVTDFPGLGDRYVKAMICGYFESARNGEFGEPPVWNHQITVSTYETIGDTLRLEKSF